MPNYLGGARSGKKCSDTMNPAMPTTLYSTPRRAQALTKRKKEHV
jgi:hypothetical protein